jgi:hypothetical protein
VAAAVRREGVSTLPAVMSRGRGRPPFFIAVAVLALLVNACGGGSESSEPTVPLHRPRPTTSLPPAGRQPTQEDPLRVTFAGDSVMAEFEPGLAAALEGEGEATSRFLLVPSLARSGSYQVLWRRELSRHDPELVVLMVGFWEDQIVGETASSEPGWSSRYREQVVEPFLDLVTSEGAKVLWIGTPATRDPVATQRFVRLNAAWEQAADERDDVDYLPGGEYLSGPQGGYADSIRSDTSGMMIRIRRTDGLHLCPAGVALLGAPVVDYIVAQWNIAIAYGWQQADWTRPPLLHAPEECPPP